MCIRDSVTADASGNWVANFAVAGIGESTYDIIPGTNVYTCLLYTSDAADERSSVDLGGRRIIKKKNTHSRR